jgi:type IV secretory pathway VirD2 relaxase
MPRGTDPRAVQAAARAFAKAELSEHRYVMVLHDHQANPHVHLSVRVESKRGLRLSPRKADLHRWREVFAEKLRHLGIDAEATRQASRGEARSYPALWRLKAQADGRPTAAKPNRTSGMRATANGRPAEQAWIQIAAALEQSSVRKDLQLAASIRRFVSGQEQQRGTPALTPGVTRSAPEVRR